MLPVFEKKWAKNAIKSGFFGVLGVQISKKILIFEKIFRKCWNFENSGRIWSNLMYNIVLKLKIGRGAEGAAKISKKGFFGQILVSVMLPFCDFEVSVMLPFSKILGHPPLNQILWSGSFSTQPIINFYIISKQQFSNKLLKFSKIALRASRS